MGGNTQEKDTVTNTNQHTIGSTSANTTGTQRSNTSSSQAQTHALTPWAGTADLLGGILDQLGTVPAALTPSEDAALRSLSGLGAAGHPYAGAIGGAATELLGGGPDRSAMVNDAYAQYRAALQPFASGSQADPASNPFYATLTNTVGNDVENRIKAMYAGSGRDPSGAGNYGYNLARGIAEGTAPVFQNQYNLERGRQLDAISGLYSAGNTTSGLLSSLDQSRRGNLQAGIGAADAAANAQAWGPMQILQAEAQRRGIPLQTLAAQYGMVLPAAQAFGTQTGSGTSTGASSGESASSSTGTSMSNTIGSDVSHSTQSTPFNPWSLAPLAFAPLSGGTSLAGLGASALGGGLFSSLSNGFLGGGNWFPSGR